MRAADPACPGRPHDRPAITPAPIENTSSARAPESSVAEAARTTHRSPTVIPARMATSTSTIIAALGAGAGTLPDAAGSAVGSHKAVDAGPVDPATDPGRAPRPSRRTRRRPERFSARTTTTLPMTYPGARTAAVNGSSPSAKESSPSMPGKNGALPSDAPADAATQPQTPRPMRPAASPVNSAPHMRTWPTTSSSVSPNPKASPTVAAAMPPQRKARIRMTSGGLRRRPASGLEGVADDPPAGPDCHPGPRSTMPGAGGVSCARGPIIRGCDVVRPNPSVVRTEIRRRPLTDAAMPPRSAPPRRSRPGPSDPMPRTPRPPPPPARRTR